MSPILRLIVFFVPTILAIAFILRTGRGQRIVAYVLLTLFAFFMLFPFLYMVFTSFKTSNDVFQYPPRFLPYTPVQQVYNDQTLPVYTFTINGEARQLVLTDEKKNFGFFTSADKINADAPRTSEILAQIPIDEVVETGQSVTMKNAAGEDKSFDLYQVTIDGQTQELPLAYRAGLDKFVDPNNPDVFTYAIARTSDPLEVVNFNYSNYRAVMGLDPEVDLHLDRALVNTALVTILVVAGQLVTSIFGGYAFSRVEFKGRDTIFVLYLGSIMIPFMVLIIPMYRLMLALGWQDRIVSLIVPWIFSAYGTFLMRQFFMSIPKELEEAALLDGASRFRILWWLFVPLSTPAIATLAIFSFLYAWNSFIWPLLIINTGNVSNHVLTLALITLSNNFADKPNFILTGAAIAILPPVIVFILAQRYFIEGISSTGLK